MDFARGNVTAFFVKAITHSPCDSPRLYPDLQQLNRHDNFLTGQRMVAV